MNVGIFIFPEVEVLDFTGPFEVFSVAARVAKRDRDRSKAIFDAFFVAETADTVRARYGFMVKPHYGFDHHPAIDILVVPGGIVDQPRSSAKAIDWIKRTAGTAHLVTSVCTGAFLLAQAGILDGVRATTHWEDTRDLQAEFPGVKVVENLAWVDQGRVVTSAGISAGIDMSLHLVARLHDKELARSAARQLVFHWRDEPSRDYSKLGFAIEPRS